MWNEMWYVEMLKSFGLVCGIGVVIAISLGLLVRKLKE